MVEVAFVTGVDLRIFKFPDRIEALIWLWSRSEGHVPASMVFEHYIKEVIVTSGMHFVVIPVLLLNYP
jgi:hypothetical protein